MSAVCVCTCACVCHACAPERMFRLCYLFLTLFFNFVFFYVCSFSLTGALFLRSCCLRVRAILRMRERRVSVRVSACVMHAYASEGFVCVFVFVFLVFILVFIFTSTLLARYFHARTFRAIVLLSCV